MTLTENYKAKMTLYISQMFRQIQFGTGGDSSNPYINTLDAPLSHTTLYTANVLPNDTTIEFTYSLQGNETGVTGQTIQEIGIFGLLPTTATETANMAKSQGAGLASGNKNYTTNDDYDAESTMLFRISIDPITIISGEVYDISVQIEVI